MRVSETIEERTARIARDHNISEKGARRVADAEVRLEAARDSEKPA